MRAIVRLTLRALRRLVPVLVVVSLLVFSIIHLIPGDPAVVAAGLEASPATVERIRVELGLDQPLAIQYARFVSRAITGDFGVSIRTGAPVQMEIRDRLPHTIALALGGVGIAVCLGLAVGIGAAVTRHVVVDRLLTAASLVSASTPSFWLALMLMLVFSLHLGWLPAVGVGTPVHYLLPSVALGLQSAGAVARMTRASVRETVSQEFVRAARAKGLGTHRALLVHALPNALMPILALVGLRVGGLLAGTVLVESVFAVPGVGRMLADGVVARDFPVVQGGVLVVAGLIVVVNAATDLLAAWIDPRTTA